MRRTLLFALCLAGCNATGGAPAYLMLDEDARSAGITVELSGYAGTPLLPFELRPGEAVTLAGPGFRTALPLEPGQLAWVRGARAEITAAEIDPDRLIVDGPPEAVRALAELVGAHTLARDDGRAELEAPDLYARASFLTAPEAIAAVEPVTRRSLGATPLVAPGAPAPAPSGPGPAIADGRLDPRAVLVGLYAGGETLLAVDGEGGFVHGDERGRWTVEEGALVLHPDGGEARALQLDACGLRDVDGTVFQSIGEVLQ